jgi:hypothetical protein
MVCLITFQALIKLAGEDEEARCIAMKVVANGPFNDKFESGGDTRLFLTFKCCTASQSRGEGA